MLHSTHQMAAIRDSCTFLGVFMRVRVFAAALVMACCFCFSLQAQSERGNIKGSVRDASGAIVPGAKVTVTNNATNVATSVSTNDAGEFTAPSRDAGTYSVRVEKEGFRPSQTTGLTVSVTITCSVMEP